jgi:Protein of unknown function (DUF2950)
MIRTSATSVLPHFVISILVLICADACTKPPAAPPPPSAFDSAAQAGAALFEAFQKEDQPALLAMFGADGKEIFSSGDASEDHDSHERFIQNYKKMHRIGLDSENRTALIIGANNWPFPIPLVNESGKWKFDTPAGKNEVLYRRIGHNENSALQICRELVAAQREYFGMPHDGQPAQQYAQRFVSNAGKHDGLFWQSSGGVEESPIGPLLAFASAEEVSREAHEGRMPFQGYYYRILKSGGARSYIVDGRMTGGFAFIAYPAEYRSSGVMTFIVGPNGIIYEKDLGADTVTQAGAIRTFEIDSTWIRQ